MSRDPVAQVAEEQNWLGPIEQPLQDAVRSALNSAGGPKLRDALHGTWLHEPLHAVLTDVPIGAWTAAVAFDSMAAMGGGSWLNKAADAALWVGIAGAAGAAVTGLNDWADLDGAPRRIGLVHALLNTAALGLFVGSAVVRRVRSRSSGRASAALGYLIVSASAHLGGNLVYEHGVGVRDERKEGRGPEQQQTERRSGTHAPAPFPEPPSDFTGEANDYQGFAAERVKNKEMLDVHPKDVGF